MLTISTLATSQCLSENHWEKRSSDMIKYITIHPMADSMSASERASYYTDKTKNSVNYCIGYNGDVACNVSEDYGAWSNTFWAVEKYSIIIDIATMSTSNFTIPIKAQASLITLITDLVQRYPSLGNRVNYDELDYYVIAKSQKLGTTIPNQLGGNILLYKNDTTHDDSLDWHLKNILTNICDEVNNNLCTSGLITTFEATPSLNTVKIAQEVIDGKWGKGESMKELLTSCGFNYVEIQNQINMMLAHSGFGLDLNKLTEAVIEDYLNKLKLNDAGCIVKLLQDWLKRCGYYTGKVDGVFGVLTELAIKQFKSNLNKIYHYDYDDDGQLNNKIWNRLLSIK